MRLLIKNYFGIYGVSWKLRSHKFWRWGLVGPWIIFFGKIQGWISLQILTWSNLLRHLKRLLFTRVNEPLLSVPQLLKIHINLLLLQFVISIWRMSRNCILHYFFIWVLIHRWNILIKSILTLVQLIIYRTLISWIKLALSIWIMLTDSHHVGKRWSVFEWRC